MNYIRNMRPPRVKVKTAMEKESQIDGFKAGVLACAWIWHEIYEVEDSDLTEMVTEALHFMYDLGDGKKDPKRINQTLEEMTGVNILEG